MVCKCVTRAHCKILLFQLERQLGVMLCRRLDRCIFKLFNLLKTLTLVYLFAGLGMRGDAGVKLLRNK
jgi:hypothetical protein